MNPANMAHHLAAVRDELKAAAGQAIEAPQYVRTAYSRAMHAVDHALDVARVADDFALGRAVAEALRTIKHAQDEERAARLAAARRPTEAPPSPPSAPELAPPSRPRARGRRGGDERAA